MVGRGLHLDSVQCLKLLGLRFGIVELSPFLVESIAFCTLAPYFLPRLVKEAEGVLLSEEAEPWLRPMLPAKILQGTSRARLQALGQRSTFYSSEARSTDLR